VEALRFGRDGDLRHLWAFQVIPRPIEEVFPFFAEAGNLERLTPPWLHFRILTERPIFMGAGTRIAYRLRLLGVPLRWEALITRWEPPRAFTDEQVKGSYALWIHCHTFTEVAGGTQMEDHVQYRLPLGPAGDLAHPAVRRWLRRIFLYRRRQVEVLFSGEGS
jgi:ligand-binding SRPBCC domain-containing protein